METDTSSIATRQVSVFGGGQCCRASRVVALGWGSCHSLGAAPEAGGILTVPVPSLAFRGRLDVLQCLGPSVQKGPCLFHRKT